MAINPLRTGELQLPPNPKPLPADFSGFAALGDAIGEYRRQQQIGDIMRAATDESGKLDYDKAAAGLSAAGLARYAEPFMNAAARREALAQSAATLAEDVRHHGAIEEAARTAKVPFGWEPTPGGGYQFTRGGPADPEYIARIAELKQKPKELTFNDITKLTEEGGKFSQLSGFGDTFKPEYAGYTVPGLGSVAMRAGRYLPEGVVGKDISDAASWWQGYDRFKNVVRNELYGASLTKSEQEAFGAADIDPSMAPAQIQKNLAIQKQVVQNGLVRRANAAISQGYDPNVIAKAYGLDLGQLGVDASGRRGSVTPAPAAPAAPAPNAGGLPPLPEGFQLVR